MQLKKTRFHSSISNYVSDNFARHDEVTLRTTYPKSVTQASRIEIELEWWEAKRQVQKQRLLWWSASTVFFWLESLIELIPFKCSHDVTWGLLSHRKGARHCVLLKLKGDRQNAQFENTTTVVIAASTVFFNINRRMKWYFSSATMLWCKGSYVNEKRPRATEQRL